MRKSIAIVVAVIFIGIIVGSLHKLDWKNSDFQDSKKESFDSIPDVSDSEEILPDSGNYTRENSSDRLAYWFPYHDSINHGLTIIAEELWLMDSAAASGNNRSRAIWYDKCKKALIHGFDSLHPHSALTDYMKADSFLAEIEAFFEKDADWTTMGMIINGDLQYKFLIYRMTAVSFQICDKDPSFEKEMKAWDGLEEAMCDFCVDVVRLDWFGGSGSGPAAIGMRNSIIQCRIDDLERIYKLYSGEPTSQRYASDEMGNDLNIRLKKSREDFKKAVEKIASSISDVNEAKEYYSDYQLEEYESLYHAVQESKNTLTNSLDKWLLVRSDFPKDVSSRQNASKNKFKENTIQMVNSLTECVIDSKND